MRIVAISAAMLLLFASCGGEEPADSENGTSTGSESSEATSQVTVTAQDFSFSPNQIDVEPGAEVEIEVKNSGSASHTFTAEDIDVDERLDPGASATVAFTAPDSGEVSWLCTIHPQMTGMIIVGGEDSGSSGGSGNDGSDSLDY